jgi:pyruvate dehydrogenase complex dehydrogenase (E1) component
MNTDKNIQRINMDFNADEHGLNNMRMNAGNENNESDNYPRQSALNQRLSVVPPIIFIGLQDTFGESGSMQDLLRKYKMDKEAIKEAVKRLIEL